MKLPALSHQRPEAGLQLRAARGRRAALPVHRHPQEGLEGRGHHPGSEETAALTDRAQSRRGTPVSRPCGRAQASRDSHHLLRRGTPHLRRSAPSATDRHRQLSLVIRVDQGRARKIGNVMLSLKLLELLRTWWRMERPTQWLFRASGRAGHQQGRGGTGVSKGPSTLRNSQTDHSALLRHAFAMHLLESGTRRAHHSAAEPSQPRDHRALSPDCHDQGVCDRESTGLAPRPLTPEPPPPPAFQRRRCGSPDARSGGHLPATAMPIVSRSARRCRPPSGAS